MQTVSMFKPDALRLSLQSKPFCSRVRAMQDEQVTEQQVQVNQVSEKNPLAVALGRLGAGKAKRLSDEEKARRGRVGSLALKAWHAARKLNQKTC